MSKHEKLVLELEHRMTVEEACDTYFKIHGPSLKVRPGAASYEQPAYKLKSRLEKIKEAWAGRLFDTLTKFDVRDFLKPYKTVGTRMRYIGCLGHIFNSFSEWNEEGNILKVKVKLPACNPVLKWRKQMKASEKREIPRSRVLTPEEWHQFKSHLSPRARAICEIALRRFLRLADIGQINYRSVKGEIIEGVQAKTGESYKIPVLDNQPLTYDFTNFVKEFKAAQLAAKLEYPIDHPMYFSVRDLRRTGATWAYKKTKDLVSISKLLGHTKIATTIHYLHIDEADRLSVTNAVDELANSQELGKSLGKTNRIGSNQSIKTDRILGI